MSINVGDRFWIEPKYTGLGKAYWFIVTDISDPNRIKIKIDGEYIESTDPKRRV